MILHYHKGHQEHEGCALSQSKGKSVERLSVFHMSNLDALRVLVFNK